jgi:hypothetical protein
MWNCEPDGPSVRFRSERVRKPCYRRFDDRPLDRSSDATANVSPTSKGSEDWTAAVLSQKALHSVMQLRYNFARGCAEIRNLQLVAFRSHGPRQEIVHLVEVRSVSHASDSAALNPKPNPTFRTRVCCAVDCRHPFKPQKQGERYCSARCRNRESQGRFRNKGFVAETISALRHDLSRLAELVTGTEVEQ